jgi:exodeoxyribonuclease-3
MWSFGLTGVSSMPRAVCGVAVSTRRHAHLGHLERVLSQRLVRRRPAGGQVPVSGGVLPAPDQLKSHRREFIVCSDVNIAHKEIDLKNWRSNQKNSGFLPEERAWMTTAADRRRPGRCVPATAPRRHRHLPTHGGATGAGLCEECGVAAGLPLGHASPGATARDVAIYKDVKFSDHAPVTVDYGFSL